MARPALHIHKITNTPYFALTLSSGGKPQPVLRAAERLLDQLDDDRLSELLAVDRQPLVFLHMSCLVRRLS